jgi:hypothetical protein
MSRPRLRSPDQSLPVRFALGTYEFFASLRLAVVLIFGFAVVLAWATFVESRYGTPAVQFGVYGTWWFAAMNLLLGVNVLCAALIRYPWKPHQIGFLVTHAGILVLLVGCWFSQRDGIDAQLPVFEGKSNWKAFEDSHHFKLEIEPLAASESADGAAEPVAADDQGDEDDEGDESSDNVVRVPFRSGPFNYADYAKLPAFPWRLARRSQGTVYDENGIRLEVLDYYSDSKRVPAPRVTLRVEPVEAASRGGLLDGAARQVTLSVQSADSPHMGGRRFGIGSRDQLDGGQRITFWMSGSPQQTEAFGNAVPKEPIGPWGQVVLWAEGQAHRFSVGALQEQPVQKLGDTGLEFELVQLDPRFLGVQLQLRGGDEPPERMMLLAAFPEFNQQAYRHEVFGGYWIDPATAAEALKSDMAGPEAIESIAQPRVDVLLGGEGALYYRQWKAPRVEAGGRLPVDGDQVEVFGGTDQALRLRVADLIAMDEPGSVLRPVPFDKEVNQARKQPQARLRLTVDGESEEFWLGALPADPFDPPPRPGQVHTTASERRRVKITMPRDFVDVGFRIYLHEFQRKLDPGTSQASHYSSLVDLVDREKEDKRLQENILITLNAPVNFSDPGTGRSYRLFQESFRGPFRPGDPIFDDLVRDGSREQLFLSWLTVNYDPGRGLKYAGSLLIVAGIAIMFYMRAYFFRPRGPASHGPDDDGDG